MQNWMMNRCCEKLLMRKRETPFERVNEMQFLFRPLWLAVPDILYFALLFGALIVLIISVVTIFYGIVKKKDTFKLRGWIITILISTIVIILTMTGRIAPYCAFGG